MEPDLELFRPLIEVQAVDEILSCNQRSARFGLVLTGAQAAELVATRHRALGENGRIEFGGGIIQKIIREFCDSPYLTEQNYAQTLNGLVEIFYTYKNETLDRISDDDLIKLMNALFDGVCRGSLELLEGRELEKIARNLRFGRDLDETDDEDDGGDADEEY
ncbi:MAG: DUF6323 family protein [Bacillota bacterium]